MHLHKTRGKQLLRNFNTFWNYFCHLITSVIYISKGTSITTVTAVDQDRGVPHNIGYEIIEGMISMIYSLNVEVKEKCSI